MLGFRAEIVPTTEPETVPSQPKISELLLVPHTHHDVGYTDSPRLIDRQHRDIVRRVLDLADSTHADGPEALRWTFEISRPVLEFVRHGDAADLARLRRHVDDGRVSVTAGYLNTTQLPGEQEIERTYEALAPLIDAGIPIRTEQHGDVNGLSWGSVPAMRRHGITRLVMALNPDHGRPPFAQPSGFWWEGPDGRRIFVLLSTHYGIGEEWGVIDGDVALAEKRVTELVEGLEERPDYPFDVAVVHAANDNRWPTLEFMALLRHWNATHPERPMRLATMDDALDRMEGTAARHELPVVRGEWADWWSHGHGSTARELAVYRLARSHLLRGESMHALADLRSDGAVDLASVLGHSRGPVRLRGRDELIDDIAEVDGLLWLFGEHTWGSWNSFSDPSAVYTASHWNAKAGFAYGAHDHARHLAAEGLFRLLASGEPGEPSMTRIGPGTDRTCPAGTTVVVANPTGRRRTEPAVVDVGDGQVVVNTDVAPFGVQTVPLPVLSNDGVPGDTVETPEYVATVDPRRGGVVSLVDRRTGRELVDTSAGHGLGALVAEVIPDGSEHPMVTRSPKDFHPDHPGPDFEHHVATSTSTPQVSRADAHVAVSWTSRLGAVRVASVLRLHPGSDLIDVDVTVTKDEVFAPESLFVVFPIAVADPRFLVETAGAAFTAEHEQLPDTSRDWYAFQHAVGVQGGNGSDGVLWGSYDAPLVQLGGFHTGAWARALEPSAGHIHSWLMNNLHFTNFRAAQGGVQTFRYRFAPRRHDAAAVRRFGDDLLRPLVTRQYAGPVAVDGAAGLRIEPADDLLVDLRPADSQGNVRARLRSLVDTSVTATVAWHAVGVVEASPVVGQSAHAEQTAQWRRLGPDGVEVRVPALGVTDVLLRRDSDAD